MELISELFNTAMNENEIIISSTKSYIKGFKRTQTSPLSSVENNDVTKLVLDSSTGSKNLFKTSHSIANSSGIFTLNLKFKQPTSKLRFLLAQSIDS